jgi:hypothetical protein
MAEESRAETRETRLEDAEELLDTLLEGVRVFTLRAAALAREEVEDVWAEAQELRRARQS